MPPNPFRLQDKVLMGHRLREMADEKREELIFLALHMSPVYQRKVSVQDHMYREKIFLAIPHLYRRTALGNPTCIQGEGQG